VCFSRHPGTRPQGNTLNIKLTLKIALFEQYLEESPHNNDTLMNDKSFNSILLAAILVTILLVVGVHFMPDRRLVLIPNPASSLLLLTEQFPDGTLSSEWINEEHTGWKCNYPENFKRNYFPCGLTLDLSTFTNRGKDLSRYENLIIHMNYSGSANKVRIAIRNFNPAYSHIDDRNSTKFNAVHLHAKDLNKEHNLALSAFAVADWWLTQYNIPLPHAAAEFTNATAITVDFGEPEKPGTHTFLIEKLELRGEWVKVEHWYLGILCLWMLGIFTYAIGKLIALNAQTQHDTQIINQLSNTNEQLREETNKFRRLSTVDPLTQLYNRFGIDQIIASLSGHGYLETSTAPKYALIIIDIDHFKHINDERGHDTGDLVLQQVAKTIQTHLRAGDYVGRWGGEEFIVIMPGSSKTSAMEMAETIREAIVTTPNNLGAPLLVSASFGVSERNEDEDFASCFKRADNALYKAKAQGRNRCVYADEQL
jgi:diguanylate cyclase (GGDEF)-like protein